MGGAGRSDVCCVIGRSLCCLTDRRGKRGREEDLETFYRTHIMGNTSGELAYMATFGIEYEHYLPETRYEGLFRGDRVKPTRRSWVKSRIVKLYGSAEKRMKRLAPRKAA